MDSNPEVSPSPSFSRRAFSSFTTAHSWEEIWEAGSYYERVAELLEDARDYAVFVGWQVDSRLPMHRPERPGQAKTLETLKEKVIRLCESKPGFQIYFLMWDHAYFYCLEREAMQGRRWDNIHPRVHFIFDNRHPFGASHHEKVILVDGKVGLCGGIDVCDERWDTPQHLYFDPRRSLNWRHENHGPYHDLAVQVTGPVCFEIHQHIARRWKYLSSIPFPEYPERVPPHRHTGHTVYVSRTIANIDAGERDTPITREIEFMIRELIQKAQARIIIEGQYFWSSQICDVLIAKIHQMKGKDFEVVLVLADLKKLKSLSRQMAYHELRLLERLENAAKEAGIRLIMGAPFAYPSDQAFYSEPDSFKDEANPHLPAALPLAKSVYVHSKLILIDDDYLCIGSANLAARALRVDTEINLTLEATGVAERNHIRRVADFVLEHWGIKPSPHHHVHLRPFHPHAEIRALNLVHPWLSRIPWGLFFDPELPWLYPLKRRYRRVARNHSILIVTSIIMVWLASALLTLAISQLLKLPANSDEAWAQIYSITLVSVWLVPIPFIPLAGLATLQIGPDLSSRIAVSTFWVAAVVGYLLTRMFPTPTSRFYRKTAPTWLPDRIGLRTFPYLMSVLVDLRVSIRSKIVYQGLYCVPVPWFIVGTLLVFPSLIYVTCRLIGAGARWFPTGLHRLQSTLAIDAPLLISAVILLSLFRMFLGLRQRDRSGEVLPLPLRTRQEIDRAPGLTTRRKEVADGEDQAQSSLL